MDKHDLKLICGLGNPGADYAKTRHNCGFMSVDRLAEKYGGSWQKTKFNAEICRAVIAGKRLLLIKPLTYMNNSGEALQKILAYYRAEPCELLVIYDDVDVPLGSVRIREKGGSGSHNGMRSIVRLLNSKDFPRMRIGIGPQPSRIDIVDYVLGRFRGEELEQIEQAVEKSVEAVETAVKDGLLIAMNRFNERNGKAAKSKPRPKPKAKPEAESGSEPKAGPGSGADARNNPRSLNDKSNPNDRSAQNDQQNPNDRGKPNDKNQVKAKAAGEGLEQDADK